MQKEIRIVPQLRFSQFEEKWDTLKFEEICKYIKSGKSKKTDEGKFVLLGSTGIIGKTNDNIENGEYLLVARVGANAGQINYVNGKFGVSDNTLIISLKENIDIGFIKDYLVKFNLNKLVFGSGQPLVTGSLLKGIRTSIPQLKEQQKIATFLTAIDSRIQSLEKKKSLLEAFKKGVMQKLFNQEIRFKDENGIEFPKWEKRKISDFVRLTLRKVPKPQGHYLSIGIRSHCKGTFQKPDTDPSKNSMTELFVVRKNDLIVNITFAWEGAIAIVKNEDDGGFVSHRFPTYECREGVIIPDFLQYVILLRRFRQNLDLISPGGAGRNRVMNKNDFLKLKWSIPCVEEQTKIANFISAIDKKIELVDKQIEKTKTYKKGLLQQMFV
ncbi:restriction endonuclease subunit S [Gelidibacter japonicus]|uniref:restriction endonuclease subunit S n=1 Tax=Gelidibacter japonicus TaxID=1962232 RepID=UPI003A927705